MFVDFSKPRLVPAMAWLAVLVSGPIASAHLSTGQGPGAANYVGNMACAGIAVSATLSTCAAIVAARPRAAACSYLTSSVAGYCLRRGILHKWPTGTSLGAVEVLRRHLVYERDWHSSCSLLRGRVMHAAHVMGWLLLFQSIYPVLELLLYPWDMAAFYFYCMCHNRQASTLTRPAPA